jgi:uncharacterized protein
MNCPICKKSVELSPKNRFRPFCSERCQLIDLGKWASDEYRIGSDDEPDDAHNDDLKKRGLLN